MTFYRRPKSSIPEAIALLQNVNLFKQLEDTQLEEIAERMSRRSFSSGTTLFHQGMPGVMLYLIETGSVRVFVIGLGGQEHTLNTFGAGSVFGELSIIDGKPRTASAITLEDTLVWLLSKDDFDELLEKYPKLCRSVVEVLAGRVRQSALHVENIIFQDVLGRLASEVLNLAKKHGASTEDVLEIQLPLTQTDLATIIGARRESVNKALTLLKSYKLLEMDGQQIRVLDPEGLLSFVEERGR